MAGDPKYLADFVPLLRELGPAVFKDEFRTPVIIGTGLVGKILSRGRASNRRTLGTAQTEELALAQTLMGRVWPIRKDPGAPPGPMIVIGQSVDNDITLAEYTLSTHHCGFSYDATRIMVTDLDSMNGTLVNGTRITANEPTKLPDKAKLSLGRLRFEFLTAKSFYNRIYKMLHGGNSPPSSRPADEK